MKYRESFVTNSSSSSFICTICDREVEGHDLELDDAEMVRCIKCFNEFCFKHLPITLEEYEQFYDKKDFIDKNGKKYIGDYYESLPPQLCPICSKEYGKINELSLEKYLEEFYPYILKEYNSVTKK